MVTLIENMQNHYNDLMIMIKNQVDINSIEYVSKKSLFNSSIKQIEIYLKG